MEAGQRTNCRRYYNNLKADLEQEPKGIGFKTRNTFLANTIYCRTCETERQTTERGRDTETIWINGCTEEMNALAVDRSSALMCVSQMCEIDPVLVDIYRRAKRQS